MWENVSGHITTLFGHPCSISAIVPAWQSADPGSNLVLADATEKQFLFPISEDSHNNLKHMAHGKVALHEAITSPAREAIKKSQFSSLQHFSLKSPFMYLCVRNPIPRSVKTELADFEQA